VAIAVSCPSCDRELKVKDELAGRKIKCPKCGEAIAVSAKLDDEMARSAKKSRKPRSEEDDDDEAEEDDRPRKKKKKKPQKNNNLMIIGAAVGGLVVVIVVVLIIILSGGGNAKTNVALNNVTKRDQQFAALDNARSLAQGRTDVRNNLVRIGLAFHNWFGERQQEKRGPNDSKELSKYYENDAGVTQVLANNQITVIWGIPKDNFVSNGNLVIAYETVPDGNGMRLVLTALGSTDVMNAAEFQAAPKAQGN
jgi:Zn-finger nucleic acid-binding protein